MLHAPPDAYGELEEPGGTIGIDAAVKAGYWRRADAMGAGEVTLIAKSIARKGFAGLRHKGQCRNNSHREPSSLYMHTSYSTKRQKYLVDALN